MDKFELFAAVGAIMLEKEFSPLLRHYNIRKSDLVAVYAVIDKYKNSGKEIKEIAKDPLVMAIIIKMSPLAKAVSKQLSFAEGMMLGAAFKKVMRSNGGFMSSAIGLSAFSLIRDKLRIIQSNPPRSSGFGDEFKSRLWKAFPWFLLSAVGFFVAFGVEYIRAVIQFFGT